MVTDYDVVRAADAGADRDSIVDLKIRGAAVTAPNDVDVVDDEPLDLPGADLSGEELLVRVVPVRTDEFTCGGCFLVQHNSRLARCTGDTTLCPECA